MNPLRSCGLVAAIITACVGASGATAQNLLVNGSFETGPAIPGNLFLDLPGGSTAIPGWTVGDFHVDYIGPGIWNGSHGVNSIDLDGSAPGPRNGSIAQTFATTVGQQYLVTFDMSGNTFGFPLVKQLEVSVADVTRVFSYDLGATIPYNPPVALSYQQESLLFTAVAPTTTLRLASLTQLSGWAPDHGAVIDDVSVVAFDSAWTGLGSSLAGVAGHPQLVGTGSLLPGSAGSLSLTQAAPSAPAILFADVSSAPIPFRCGTLVPGPTILTFVLGTSPSGEIPIAWTTWPAGLSGIDLYFQYGIKDSAAVCGVSLSNAVLGENP